MTQGAALDLRDRVRDVPDFPKPGIVFKDLMPLVADPAYFKATIDELAALAAPLRPDVILGAKAKVELVEQLGGQVVGLLFVIELSFLNAREKLTGYDVRSLISY